MALTPAILERGINDKFQQGLKQEVDSRLMAAVMTINSNGRTEDYGWLEAIGTLEELIDEVTIDGVYKSNYSLANKTFVKAISATLADIEDDQVGGIMQTASDLAVRGRMFPQVQVVNAVIDNGTCFDGKAFFATDHETGASGAQSNLLTGTGTDLTDLELDFNTALEAMLAWNDASGNPIHETDTMIKPLVFCPVGLFGKFRTLQNAALINNQTNVLQGTFDLVSSSRLTADDVNDWYMMNVGSTLKPFIWQNRVALSLVSLNGKSDIGVLRERYVWKVRLRGRAGYGFPSMAVKTTNT